MGHSKMQPTREDLLREAAVHFVGAAAFPRLAYRLSPASLRPRGLVVYIVVTTLVGFWARAWALPRMIGWAEESKHVRAELEERLGRAPTPDELYERHRERRAETERT